MRQDLGLRGGPGNRHKIFSTTGLPLPLFCPPGPGHCQRVTEGTSGVGTPYPVDRDPLTTNVVGKGPVPHLSTPVPLPSRDNLR